MNPLVYCTLITCTDKEWDVIAEVAAIVIAAVVVVAILSFIFDKKDE